MFKPARARQNPMLDHLKQQFQRLFGRALTAREEKLLELSEPLLAYEDADGKEGDSKGEDSSEAA